MRNPLPFTPARGRAAAVEGLSLASAQQRNEVRALLLVRCSTTGAKRLWVLPPVSPGTRSAGARPARHAAAAAPPRPRTFAKKHQTETKTVGSHTLSFELWWRTAARSYLLPGDLRLAWPGGKKH